MAMTLKRFLYLSMNFSNTGSLALDDTYSEDVVFGRTAMEGSWGCLIMNLTNWILIEYESSMFTNKVKMCSRARNGQ